jgi:hypothetical protein
MKKMLGRRLVVARLSLCMPFLSFIIQILTVHQFGALGMIGDRALQSLLMLLSWPIMAI